MKDGQATWTEENSATYRELAPVAVPARAEQIAALLTLLPFGREEAFRAVEIGAGAGALAYAILDAFPAARVTALDGSASMRAQTAQRLGRFGARAAVAPFELTATEWLAHLEGADCAVSSLCLHHLDGPEKQRFFAAACARLTERGALLIADLVAPQRPEGRELFAATWDRAAEEQALAEDGTVARFERFRATQWNYYRYPDPFDKPSPLFDQLTWLKLAGFVLVDCYWLRAGHAIYGGYKSPAVSAAGQPLAFEDALQSAQRALGATSGAGDLREAGAEGSIGSTG
jgi:tRNA (cmo5U34)-methyltransferase